MNNDDRESILVQREPSLTELVRSKLEALILDGDLEAGSRLNEQHLAKRLGISRGPVREAARLLERDGLVNAVVNHGVYVRKLSLEEALELYDLRAVIAGHACSCLAKRAGKAELAELRALVAKMDKCMERRDEQEYFGFNLEFHDRIAELSGARRTFELYISLGKEVRLMRRRVLQGVESMRFSNQEHKEILAAVELGDSAQARQAAEKHHINGKRRWLDTL